MYYYVRWLNVFCLTQNSHDPQHNEHYDNRHHDHQVCEMIEGLVPDSVHPLCDSVVAHIMITAIYGMITKITTALQVLFWVNINILVYIIEHWIILLV